MCVYVYVVPCRAVPSRALLGQLGEPMQRLSKPAESSRRNRLVQASLHQGPAVGAQQQHTRTRSVQPGVLHQHPVGLVLLRRHTSTMTHLVTPKRSSVYTFVLCSHQCLQVEKSSDDTVKLKILQTSLTLLQNPHNVDDKVRACLVTTPDSLTHTHA